MTLRIDMLSVHTSPLFNYYTYIKNVVDRVYLHCIDPQLDELRMNCREKDGKKRTESEHGYRTFPFAVISTLSSPINDGPRAIQSCCPLGNR
jgi:hypothetical protein